MSDDANEPRARHRGPFAMTPIGFVRSPYRERFGTPQQGAAHGSSEEAILALDPAIIPAESLRDLVGMDRIWVITMLHLVDSWRPTVRPPRGPKHRRGVFGTRSPHRPNPIGLSAVELVRVDGTNLHVRGIDLLDETPILDIKPYLPYADAFPDARTGWIEALAIDTPQTGRAMGARHRRKAARGGDPDLDVAPESADRPVGDPEPTRS